MKVHGIVWAGTRAQDFEATVAFFRDVLGLDLRDLRDDFAWFRLDDTSQLEVFGPDEPEHGHFTTGPVPSLHVDDVHAAVEELRRHGVETFGPWGEPSEGWAHFRAPDGNIYGLSASAAYRR